MSSAVCTLFEGHYHYGVAALANSLYKQGYRGSIYIGYKGSLPPWALKSIENTSIQWNGTVTFTAAKELELHFLPLETNYHLTNYKPDFILELLRNVVVNANAIFYFDPDIVITAPWHFFENWVKYGLALSEDVNSPLPKNHPRRREWRQYFGDHGLSLFFKDPIYVNGGFIGIAKEYFNFIEIWKHIQEIMAEKIGGLMNSSLMGKTLPEKEQSPFFAFGKTDQDALNAAIEAWDGSFSFIGKESMSFKPGVSLMPHAIGTPKSWNKNFIKAFFLGKPPTVADKAYWSHAKGVINIYSNRYLKMINLLLKVTSFLGRFYRRS